MKSKLSQPTVQIHTISTAAGQLTIGEYQGKLCLCDWVNRDNRLTIERRVMQQTGAELVQGNSDFLHRVQTQIDDFFDGKRKDFDLPLLPLGTPFQCLVWDELLKIPHGATTSYLDIAKALGRPKAVRAVAGAIGANAISVVIPCHRVIGSSGKLTGYAGGLEAKQKLLALEQR